MKRRTFLGATAASFFTADMAQAEMPTRSSGGTNAMNAGFARVDITPPVGTTMMGFGARDMDHGCTGV
ncbi:MAG: hypothetical protein R6V12_17210, partial [Candidatus Hydrogenedentota bacterium]